MVTLQHAGSFVAKLEPCSQSIMSYCRSLGAVQGVVGIPCMQVNSVGVLPDI